MPVKVKCFHCSMAHPTGRSQVVHWTNTGRRQNKTVTYYLVQILFRKQSKRCQVTQWFISGKKSKKWKYCDSKRQLKKCLFHWNVKTVCCYVCTGLQRLTLRWHNGNTLNTIQCWIYITATHSAAFSSSFSFVSRWGTKSHFWKETCISHIYRSWKARTTVLAITI